MYTSSKISKKKNIEIPVSLFFGTSMYQICPKFRSTDHTHFTFLAGFQWNMLGDSIDINNLSCNPEVLKKCWYNLLKIVFLGPICTKKGS